MSADKSADASADVLGRIIQQITVGWGWWTGCFMAWIRKWLTGKTVIAIMLGSDKSSREYSAGISANILAQATVLHEVVLSLFF